MTITAGDRLKAELDALAAMDLAALRRRWRETFGRAAPPGLSCALTHRALAYRVQARALGDLDPETARMLDRIARTGSAGGGEGRGVTSAPGRPVSLPGADALSPGTTLVREWRGVLHSVTVMESGGFAWSGRTLTSLSAAARAITGTNWNGPRFFGLRAKAKGAAP